MKTVAPVIGVSNAHYALLISDPFPPVPGSAEPPALPEYGEVKPMPGTRAISISSADSSSTEIYDDGDLMFNLFSKGVKTISFERASVSNAEKADFLGHKRTAAGVYFESSDSIPPALAFGFRRTKQNDLNVLYYDYVWYLKGQMSMNENAATTRQETVTLQNRSLTGTFGTRICDGVYVITISSDDEDFDAELAETWFTQATLNQLYTVTEDAVNGASGEIPAGLKVYFIEDDKLMRYVNGEKVAVQNANLLAAPPAEPAKQTQPPKPPGTVTSPPKPGELANA
jgi:phi13 family phage major tail protein